MKFNEHALAALVASMTLASRLDGATAVAVVASSSVVSASEEELHPRPGRKVRDVPVFVSILYSVCGGLDLMLYCLIFSS